MVTPCRSRRYAPRSHQGMINVNRNWTHFPLICFSFCHDSWDSWPLSFSRMCSISSNQAQPSTASISAAESPSTTQNTKSLKLMTTHQSSGKLRLLSFGPFWRHSCLGPSLFPLHGSILQASAPRCIPPADMAVLCQGAMTSRKASRFQAKTSPGQCCSLPVAWAFQRSASRGFWKKQRLMVCKQNVTKELHALCILGFFFLPQHFSFRRCLATGASKTQASHKELSRWNHSDGGPKRALCHAEADHPFLPTPASPLSWELPNQTTRCFQIPLSSGRKMMDCRLVGTTVKLKKKKKTLVLGLVLLLFFQQKSFKTISMAVTAAAWPVGGNVGCFQRPTSWENGFFELQQQSNQGLSSSHFLQVAFQIVLV